MKAIALFIATLMILLGLTGILWPEGVMQLASYSFSRTGLYVVAAVRIILGGLLFFAATATRTPKTIRVIALILMVAWDCDRAYSGGTRAGHERLVGRSRA